MKKKIKDLTLGECKKICKKETMNGITLCEYTKCPLLFAGTCLIGFIEKLQYVQKEVEVDED